MSIIQPYNSNPVLPNWLAEEIVNEITDPKYQNRTHGTRSCHNAGCTGPLCKKFNKDRQREWYRKQNPLKAHPRPGSKDPALDKFLDEVIAVHVTERRARTALRPTG